MAHTRHTGKPALDPARVRSEFPVLSRFVRDGKPLVYLDNAATSQKPALVIEALDEYYRHYNANVHRAIHHLAEEATTRYEEARTVIGSFIGAENPREVIFTRGTTESINLVAHAWGRKYVGADDEIMLSEMEHHSNMIPWQLLAKATGSRLVYIPVLENGELDLDAYRERLSSRTRLVALTQMSNVLGTINPVADMIRDAHRAGARVLVDGAQSVPHMPVDVKALDCDFLAFSGHKMCGPTGIGILYAKEELLETMDPFHGGGEMISKVSWHEATWADLPHKFEAGTPNIADAIGLAAAVGYLSSLGMDDIHRAEQALTAYALEALRTIEGLRIYGDAANRGGAISFVMEGIHPHDISHFVDQDGVAVRAGHMCCQPMMKKFGHPAMTRASLYLYNTRDDVDRLVEALERVKGFFNRAT